MKSNYDNAIKALDKIILNLDKIEIERLKAIAKDIEDKQQSK